MVEIDSSLSENNICSCQLYKCSTTSRSYPPMTFQACISEPSRQMEHESNISTIRFRGGRKHQA
jgi:hypothetical protein